MNVTTGPAKVLFRIEQEEETVRLDVNVVECASYGLWYRTDDQKILAPWSMIIEVVMV